MDKQVNHFIFKHPETNKDNFSLINIKKNYTDFNF